MKTKSEGRPKRAGGRPRIGMEQKAAIFSIRLEASERAEIEAAAALAGVKASAWARNALLEAAQKSAQLRSVLQRS